jgi:hypothetical protein
MKKRHYVLIALTGVALSALVGCADNRYSDSSSSSRYEQDRSTSDYSRPEPIVRQSQSK